MTPEQIAAHIDQPVDKVIKSLESLELKGLVTTTRGVKPGELSIVSMGRCGKHKDTENS